jgi:HTH-type transcriptional regulator/antitoxin HigA
MANYKPYINVGPGEFIKEELETRSWRQEDLAAILGLSLKSVNQLIKNKQAITVETAQLLSTAFGQSPQYWLALDANYRLRLNQRQEKRKAVGIKAYIYKYMPINAMIKRGWLKSFKTVAELKKEVLRFWDIKKLDFSFLEKISVPNLRKSQAFTQYNKYHALTWFTMAKKCAALYRASAYQKKALLQMSNDISKFTIKEEGVKDFLKELTGAGVKFLVLRHLPKTYTDGSAFMDNGNPVIAYTLRYDRIDNFWFTLAHELCHILLHLKTKKDYFIDNLDCSGSNKEKQSDEFALRLIKAKETLDYFKPFSNYISEARVNDCARALQISPAIIVGVLQHHDMLPRRNLNNLKPPVSNKIPQTYWAEKRLANRSVKRIF